MKISDNRYSFRFMGIDVIKGKEFCFADTINEIDINAIGIKAYIVCYCKSGKVVKVVDKRC